MSGFKTKARTVELLGRKQIRDSVTALAELMKNAYDADAPWLRVEFSTTGSNQHYRVETYKKQQFVIPGHLKQYFSESLLAAITEKIKAFRQTAKNCFCL